MADAYTRYLYEEIKARVQNNLHGEAFGTSGLHTTAQFDDYLAEAVHEVSLLTDLHTFSHHMDLVGGQRTYVLNIEATSSAAVIHRVLWIDCAPDGAASAEAAVIATNRTRLRQMTYDEALAASGDNLGTQGTPAIWYWEKAYTTFAIWPVRTGASTHSNGLIFRVVGVPAIPTTTGDLIQEFPLQYMNSIVWYITHKALHHAGDSGGSRDAYQLYQNAVALVERRHAEAVRPRQSLMEDLMFGGTDWGDC